jgi:hypothetical protein
MRKGQPNASKNTTKQNAMLTCSRRSSLTRSVRTGMAKAIAFIIEALLSALPGKPSQRTPFRENDIAKWTIERDFLSLGPV